MPTINLATLAASAGFIIRGDNPDDRAGFSVSAGDINGDGYDDLIIGASDDDDGGSNSGAVYVVFGKASGFGFTDLTGLSPTDGFEIIGDTSNDDAGFSVSALGDINGDGIDDLAIGAIFAEQGGAEAGSTYVIFGKTGGFSNIDLTTLAPTAGFVIQGDVANDRSGYSVSLAGDVNGDGFEDLIIGATQFGFSATGPGKAYVIFGTDSGFGTIDGTGRSIIDLSTFSLSVGFTITGDANGDSFGISVEGGGDFNGDGIDDLIVGARKGDNGGTDAGEAYIIFGTVAGFNNLDVTGLVAGTGIIIQGDVAGDQAGQRVSWAGDVNGDGFDDVIVGAPYGDDGGSAAGEVYVIFGKPNSLGVDLTVFGASDGFIIRGDTAGDLAGTSVASAGDFNGDGFDDIIIGAIYGDDGGNNAGEAYLIFGKASGFGTPDAAGRPVIDLTNLGNDGIVLQGAAATDRTGTGVAAGDVNGDGFSDLVIGAGYNDLGGTNAGQAYVVFGSGAGDFPLVFELSSHVAAVSGVTLIGDQAGDQAGYSVSSAGDVNGDGFDDFIVGAPYNDGGGDQAGKVYVIFGKAGGIATLDLGNVFAPTNGFFIQGDAPGDYLGISVAAAGDVNGDGFDDLIVGAPYGDNGGTDAGEAYVIFGKPTNQTVTIDLSSLTLAQGYVIQGDFDGDRAGWSVSGAGDINGDGFDDVIVGARLGDNGGPNAGEAYVLFGKSGFANIDLATLSASDGFVIQGDFDADQLGRSVARAGDVNNDGFDDLIVGAPNGDDGGTNAGEAYVILGHSGTTFTNTGPNTIDLTTLSGTQGFIIRGDAAGDYAGFDVNTAGDVNGDGFDDLIVGAWGSDVGGAYAGAAWVVFGKAGGFGIVDLTSLAASAGFLIRGDAADDYAGYSVASAGDVNGDGFDDILIGAYGADGGGSSAGRAYVIFGKASGFGTIDLGNLNPTQGFIVEGHDTGDRTGWSVEGAGDVNNDGFADLIVGARLADGGGSSSGEAYLIYGRDPARAVTRIGTDIGQTIRGGDFDDVLVGAGGNDILIGVGGNDTLNGGTGVDTMNGGAGNDIYIVDNAADSVVEAGGGGFDILYTSLSWTLADGLEIEGLFAENAGATTPLTLVGNAFVQIIAGNAGANFLSGRGGADTLVGRAGNDTYTITNSDTEVFEAAGEGFDIAFTTVNWSIRAGQEIEALFADDAASTVPLSLVGNELGQVIAGNAGDNTINGLGGADTLVGRAGNDTYVVGNPNAEVFESAGEGFDIVYTTSSWSIRAGQAIEALFANDAASTAPLSLAGNELVQVIAGNAGDNTLNGLGGADTLVGRAGNDTYVVSDPNAEVFEAAGEGNDTVFTTTSWSIRAGQAIEALFANDAASTAPLSLAGNELAQTIAGNAGANSINGLGGADTLVGRGGNDSYKVTDSATQVFEAAGEGNDTVSTTVTWAMRAGQEIEALLVDDAASTTAIDLAGNEFAQLVAGNAGANRIDGGAGSDSLVGRGGADSFAFTTALGPSNVDTIFDYQVGVDRFLLDDAVFTGLATGALAAGAFRLGTTAQDADDRILYDAATGRLFFDADGAGGAAAVQFASVTPGLNLTASEFTVI